MKMHLLRDCIKVETNGAPLPEDIMTLEPYHFNRSHTVYYFSLFKMPEVLKVFGKDLTALPKPVMDRYNYVMWQRRAIEELLHFGPQGDPVVNEHLTLRRHQELAREVARVYPKFAFYYDTRTGKTPLSIAIMLDDIREHPDHKWLVVAPLVLLDLAWADDMRKFAPELKFVICHDKTKAKRLEKIRSDANVYIINTESFVNYIEYFEGVSRLILDESSSMKNKSSKFSKAIVDFSRTADRLYLLSGTPAPNGAHEYYRQIQAIDYYGIQQSFAQFKNKYFLNLARDVRFEQLVLRPDMQDELQLLIRQYALYVNKEDVLDTPGRKMIEYSVDMPVDVKDHYKKMKKDLYTSVATERDILAGSAATKLNKLNQITSGFLIDTEARLNNSLAKHRGGTGDEQEVYLLSDFRFKALAELLSKIGDQQVIIWANYHVEFEYIGQMLGAKCVQVYGEVPQEEKVYNIRQFKEGKAQYLVANPASADKGLTLTNCHICIYFSLNWSYESFKQSMERIYGDRSIQAHECQYYIMEAKGTLNEVIYREVLVGKQAVSQAILDYLKADD